MPCPTHPIWEQGISQDLDSLNAAYAVICSQISIQHPVVRTPSSFYVPPEYMAALGTEANIVSCLTCPPCRAYLGTVDLGKAISGPHEDR
jgi:hypothetical protein